MTKSRLGILMLALAAARLSSACVDAPGIDALPDDVRAKAPASLWDDLPRRPIILALRPGLVTAGATDVDRRAVLAEQKARVLGGAGATIDEAWDELPLVQVRPASVDDAAALIAADDVLAAYEVATYELSDAESFPLINQPGAAAAGKIGAGTAVAVLDTGTDYARADFGACGAPGGACKVAFARDFAADDGARDDNGHGTNVAGIALGVAPGTKILALDVFAGAGASSTDIISAINWSITNKATYGIAAMNLSLGGGASTTTCPNDAMGIALAAARDAGIAPVVAAGNNGYASQLAYPACAPAAISVGAVYDTNVGGLAYSNCTDATTAADKIACFSNSTSFLSLLAPGALITAGGYTMAGTSQATPHVAGAIAVLRAGYPGESVTQLVARLTSTGKRLTDPRNGVITSRIDLAAALGAPVGDVTAPTGTVVINGGAALTGNRAVTLAITATDAGGLATMCVTSTTAACAPFEPFATTRAWTLPTGDGAKTVLVYLRDKAGNTTTATTSPRATITLDATAPTGGAAIATGGNARVALTWSGFADAGAGLAGYRVVGGTAAAPPATCAGALLYGGTAVAFSHTGLTNGTTYQYRICALDAAGNLSTGVVTSAMAKPEANAPVGTIVINGGATVTRALTLTLTLTATDATRVDTMCLSEATTCTAFVAYAPTKAFTLAAGDGVRTVRAWFRDPWGNTSSPVTATIKVDTALPTGGAVVATYGDARVALTWSGFADAGTGIASYRVVVAPTTAPANCLGTPIYTGAARAFSHTGLTNGTAYAYRVCAVDAAGNTSAGAVSAVVSPRPESTPPVGTIAIGGGAPYTASRTVALALAATDASGVTTMCIAEATTCTAYVPYATTRSLTFAAGEGTRTVRVWYRDRWGNTAAPVAASIKVDTVAPATGALAGTAAVGAIKLTWPAATDATSGVARYRLVGAAGTTAPATCAAGTLVYTGAALTFAHATTGTWSYRLCAVDNAGNTGAGTTRTATAR